MRKMGTRNVRMCWRGEKKKFDVLQSNAGNGFNVSFFLSKTDGRPKVEKNEEEDTEKEMNVQYYKIKKEVSMFIMRGVNIFMV